MRPSLHPSLVNGRWGDPALYVEMLHRRDALLFDVGDLSTLSARDLLRVSHIFVSHGHIDHFIGFDALLRVMVGRDKTVFLYGPEGFADLVHHKLRSYTWDLVGRYDTDLVFEVLEVEVEQRRRFRFRFKRRFEREELGREAGCRPIAAGPGFEVSAAVLAHHGPCLGFAVEEPAHVNLWKVKLEESGLAAGPWLQLLKQAVVERWPDSHAIATPLGERSVGELRDLVTLSRGQKIAYVTDLADTPANREAIARLAAGADTLFIEARFSAADRELARQRAHLTTDAAGMIARVSKVRKVEPFHFSPRYEGEEARMLSEISAAFAGDASLSNSMESNCRTADVVNNK